MAGTGRGHIGVQRNQPIAHEHIQQLNQGHSRAQMQMMEKPEMEPCVEVPNNKPNGQGAAEDEGE